MPGVPVGVITKVEGTASSLTKLALVRPYADDTALGVVGVVIVAPRTNPRFSVLPPSPAPAREGHRHGDRVARRPAVRRDRDAEPRRHRAGRLTCAVPRCPAGCCWSRS